MKTPHTKQQGAALIVTILLLVLISLMAITAARTGIMEERLARSARGRTMSFTASESALNDARREILSDDTSLVRSDFFINAGAAHASDDCGTSASNARLKGICTAATTGSTRWAQYMATAGTTRGSYITNKPFSTSGGTAAVAAEPRYLIEIIPISGTPGETSTASYKNPRYRVTSEGFGPLAATTVWLQETIQRPFTE